MLSFDSRYSKSMYNLCIPSPLPKSRNLASLLFFNTIQQFFRLSYHMGGKKLHVQLHVIVHYKNRTVIAPTMREKHWLKTWNLYEYPAACLSFHLVLLLCSRHARIITAAPTWFGAQLVVVTRELLGTTWILFVDVHTVNTLCVNVLIDDEQNTV